MSKSWFYFTADQMNAIMPLWDKARHASKEGKPGAILFQPFPELDGRITAKGSFFPAEVTDKINAIIVEYKKSLGTISELNENDDKNATDCNNSEKC